MGKLPNIKKATCGTIHRGAGLLMVMLVAGCASMQPGYDAPSVTVKSFRALPTTGAMPNFEIALEVMNPNEEELKLAGIAYTISLEGHEIVKGVGNDLPAIEGYGTGTVMVTASASLFAGIGLFTDMMQSPKDTFEYSFEAKLDPGGFRPAVRVKDGGTISAGALHQ